MSRNTRMVEVETVEGLAGRLGPLLQNNAQGCRVYSSANRSLANNTWTVLAFDTEDYDSDDCWGTSDPTKLVANTPGFYLVGGVMTFANTQVDITGRRVSVAVRAVKSGGTAYQSPGVTELTVSGEWASASEITGLWLGAGDYVQIMGYQNMGTTKTAQGAAAWIHGWMARIPGI